MPISPELNKENTSPLSDAATGISGGKIQNGNSSKVSHEDEWGKAQQRLILYLQSLKIPPFEVLELALEALKIAGEKWESAEKGSSPITASMRALRQLLSRRKPKGELKAEKKQMILILPFLEESDLFRGVQSMPPLNRGTMLPETARQRISCHLTSPSAPS
jgi:hypothetical protein